MYDSYYCEVITIQDKKKEKKMKIKKILTEIVKIGGWIIVALEKLLEVL